MPPQGARRGSLHQGDAPVRHERGWQGCVKRRQGGNQVPQGEQVHLVEPARVGADHLRARGVRVADDARGCDPHARRAGAGAAAVRHVHGPAHAVPPHPAHHERRQRPVQGAVRRVEKALRGRPAGGGGGGHLRERPHEAQHRQHRGCHRDLQALLQRAHHEGDRGREARRQDLPEVRHRERRPRLPYRGRGAVRLRRHG
mmetsp:Transcript_35656/g.112487  ORF Transcript_35656/g.112487 Transcript_35656/m.112487 type:complete len:200 (+) Transcript_35656:540-1139(+)